MSTDGAVIVSAAGRHISSASDLNLAGMQAWHRARRRPISLFIGSRLDQPELLAVVMEPGLQIPALVPGIAPLAAWRRAFPEERLAMQEGPSPRAALLDRDGTVIIDRHYLADPAGVDFVPGAIDGLRLLSAGGVILAIVTNQSGVGRGRITPQQLDAVHARIRTDLAANGIVLAGIYACPHHPDDGCDCRKPAPGLIRQATEELALSPGHIVVIGDRPADVDVAARTGTRSILVLTGEGTATFAAGTVTPDFVVENLTDAAAVLLHPAGLPVGVSLPPVPDRP